MSEYAIALISENHPVVVEVESERNLAPASRLGDAAGRVVQTFEEALDGVRAAADAIDRHIRLMAKPPAEITAEFSIKLASEVGAVIAKGTSEANLKLSLCWKTDTES